MDLSSLTQETPQLTLRPLRPEDYAAFLSGFRACGPARNRFDDGQFDLSFLREDWYAGLLARRQREAEADISYVLNLFRREDGVSVGYCDITTQQREDFQWGRIGYTVLNPYWGRGYGTECARALVSLGFRELGFHRLEAHVNLDNPASQRVLTKAGFVREGIRKAFIRENGVWTDNLIYTIIAPDGAESEDACGA